jgi:succinyl-diaminopimelate desuccinylase
VPFDGADWTRDPLGERVVEEPVYRRSATGGGDAKVLRHAGVPTVEFGFGTQTAHGTDEYTTTAELIRNATAYALLPYEYDRQRPDGA